MHRARRRHGGNASARLSWEAPARWTDAPETHRYQAAHPLPLRERWQPWSCGRATMRHTARPSCATGGREPRGRVLAAQRAECAQLSSCADGGHCAQRLRLGARCEHGSPLSHCGATHHEWRRPSEGHAECGRADGRSARQDSAWRSGAASRERRQPRLWIGARHCAGDVWKLIALAVPVEGGASRRRQLPLY